MEESSRAAYFSELHREDWNGQQASSLYELLTIRALHSESFRRRCLGSAVGFRTRDGKTTDIPAVIFYVARKVHARWLLQEQLLPRFLKGPGGIWCDADVVEFSYYGSTTTAPGEQIYGALVEHLRGNATEIASGSQVSSVVAYGTMSALVRSKIGEQKLGFLTNRHVADMSMPTQRMYHPLPPTLGPGVYLGSVERATSFVPDDKWYGFYASTSSDAFVKADGAFVPFSDEFDMSRLSTRIRGLNGRLLPQPKEIKPEDSVGNIVGKKVVKLGRSSGMTSGVIMGYGVEYNDDKGHSYFTDFLIVGQDNVADLPFDIDGDSGSLILISDHYDLTSPDVVFQPLGIVWGGTANRGRLKLHPGRSPTNWTSGVDLHRVLEFLCLELVATPSSLHEEVDRRKQKNELKT